MKESIVRSMYRFTALSCLVLACAGFAHAGTVGTNRVRNTRKGTLKIKVATDVGGFTLEPGNYEVKQVNSSAGPVIRFTRLTYNPYAPEGVSAYQWDTVAEIKCAVEPLASTPERTTLLFASNNTKAIGLEIRGNSVDYRVVASER